MDKMWSEYVNDVESFGFSVHISVNRENYVEKILKFDSNFLQLTDFYGLHKIHCLTDENFTIAEFINKYQQNRIIQLHDGSEDIALMRIYDWDFLLENSYVKKLWDISILLPIKVKEVWEYKHFSISGENNSLILQYYGLGFDLEKLKDNQDKDLIFVFYSKSTVWFDEIEMDFTSIGGELEKFGYSTFDLPFDNRPTAYRITPRFNSFLRDLRKLTEELEGRFEVGETIIPGTGSTFKNPEGYILLDHQVVFQEDIDSGKVKIPD